MAKLKTTGRSGVARRLRVAYVAASFSEENTQVGALIVSKDGREITGWNHRADGGLVHAEQAAINAAADLGIDIYGATMYAPWHACVDICAPMIVEAGIRRVFGHLPYKRAAETLTPSWTETVDRGIELLTAAGVESVWFVDPIAARVLTIRGQRYDPAEKVSQEA